MSQLDTKDKILDVAEELFAKHGYKGTSMRAIITSQAEVNLAAVNYHCAALDNNCHVINISYLILYPEYP